jgi:YrbI family 3-deoxy-D-manno-octulosonate 8-phosphate phosphatase
MGARARVHAVIPARGGSKGILRKNLALVDGVPIVVRAIDAVRACSLGVTPIVTTDDPEIAATARAAGATIVDRPADLSGDLASSESAVLHALDHVAATDDDIALFVQCTSPFIHPRDLDDLVAAVEAGADSAFLAVPFHRFVWRDDGSGRVVGANHDHSVRERRQDRPLEWLETGAAYAMRIRGLRAHGHRFFGTVVAVPSASPDLEIDAAADLEAARGLASSSRLGVSWPWPALPDLLILDFDGVLTDNRVWTSQDGVESVVSSRSDGLGIALLRDVVPIAVVSTEVNLVVSRRCAKLGIPCVQAVGLDKTAAVRALFDEHQVEPERVAYVGNDVNDLGALDLVGYPIAVADAHVRVREAARLVLTSAGGHGAVRELAEAMLTSRRQPAG